MSTLNFKDPQEANTAELVTTGLVAGWIIAKETGLRSIGGIVLGGVGAYATCLWTRKSGAATAAVLTATYLGAFVGSHKLAKKIGAWPSVVTVTTISSAAAYLLNDRK